MLAGIDLYSDRTYGADMAAMDYARDPANEAYTDAMKDWLTGAQTSALGPPNARERVSYAAARGEPLPAADAEGEPTKEDWQRWPGAAAARHRSVLRGLPPPPGAATVAR